MTPLATMPPRDRSIHAGPRASRSRIPHGREVGFPPFAAHLLPKNATGSRLSSPDRPSATRSTSADSLKSEHPPSRFGGWVGGPLRRVSAFLGAGPRLPPRRLADLAPTVREYGRELARDESR